MTSMGHRTVLGWIWLMCTLFRSAATTMLTPATPSSSGRPVIRLALIIDAWGSPAVAEYLMDHLNTSNRTFLPDFDILIDTWKIKPSSDQAPVALVAMLSDDTPTYHAVTGPFDIQDTLDLVPVAARARMPHISFANSPRLSDRTLYPYTFRMSRSLKGEQLVIFYMVSMNNWHSVISLWQEQDVYDTSIEVAMQHNVTNYPTLVDRNAADWVVDAWQTDIVAFVKSSRVRVLILRIEQERGWQFACRIHRAQMLGMQYFVEEQWTPDWFLANHSSLGDCTGDEMYVAVAGYLVTFHSGTAPGANMLGYQTPTIDGVDESKNPLTCTPHLTVNDFFNDGDLLTRGFMAGDLSLDDIGGLQMYISVAGLIYDGACASLLALHDAIYNKGLPFAAIEKRSSSTFEEVIQSINKVEFQSPIGSFSFYENSGDPRDIYHMVAQRALPGIANDSFSAVATVTFPHRGEGQPKLVLLNESKPLIWRDGSTGLGPKAHLGTFPDCAKDSRVLVWDSCQPCPAGTAFDPLLQACRTCPIGQYQNQSGMASCETAPPGFYIMDVTRPIAMAMCPLGHECPQAGTVSPQPCAKGRYASNPGMATCELCPAGQYQNAVGKDACISCTTVLAGGVTAAIASTSASQCICPSGTFRDVGADQCSLCLAGMRCPEGSDMRHVNTSIERALPYPQVLAGYMTLSAEPLTVYKCGETVHCPGGPPASCASFRDSSTVACGDCVDGAYESGESCLECGEAGALPFIFLCIAMVALVLVVTVLINNDVHKVTGASMMAMTVCSLLVTGLQTIGVFSTVDIPWENPLKRVLELAELLRFDLDLVKASCVMGVNPLRAFAFRQLAAIVIIPCVWFTLALKKYMPKWGKPKTAITVELCNAVGTLYTVFYISILLAAVDPFICYQHPGESGESVRSAPSLLCFEGGEHTSMIIIGAIAMVVIPLPFCCLCAYGIAIYPREIKRHSSSKFLHATRFLFLRYAPDRYYFQLIALARSLFLCLIPAILRDKDSAQVLFICIILCVYMFAADNLQPWRARPCNPLDSVITMLFVILLVCGALFIENQPQKEMISVLSSSILGCVLLGALIAFAYAVWHHFAPSYFQYFICHHKAHAAAQSRYIKILLLKKRSKARVFIDSDNLQELDTLFDIVKSRVRHLLVFLTADTLKRPWCVGEIVTALRTSLPVTRIQTSSFTAPTDEQCANPEDYVDTTGCNLSEYGIQWSDVTWAYSVFLSYATMQLEMPKLPGTRRFDRAITNFLKDRVVQSKVHSLCDLEAGGVLVVSHTENDEASAAAGIMVDRLAPDVYRSCEQGMALLCDYEQDAEMSVRAAQNAAVVIVILSPGCLQSSTQLHIISAIMSAQAQPAQAPGRDSVHSPSRPPPAIISINIPGFEFPSPVGIAELCKAHGGAAGSGLDNRSFDHTECDVVAQSVVAFFKRISLPYPTHAAQHALDTQSDEIFRRIQAGLNQKLKLAPTREGSSLSRLHFTSTGVSNALVVGTSSSLPTPDSGDHDSLMGTLAIAPSTSKVMNFTLERSIPDPEAYPSGASTTMMSFDILGSEATPQFASPSATASAPHYKWSLELL